MIVIVAPYSPAGRSMTPNLGAARKIETVISILSNFRAPIVLINTAHDQLVRSPMSRVDTTVAGVQITEVFPQTYENRRVGKLLNLFDARAIVDYVLSIGTPSLGWLYNGYAMESRVGSEFQRRTGCCVIQEMEDWHFSRSRGLNPKPMLDWLFWRKMARQASHVFAVNDALADKVRRLKAPRVSLFPGVVNREIAAIRKERPPFTSADGVITVGYFGGLSVEKGADRILALCGTLPERFRLIVTGSGPLEEEFVEVASNSNGKLEFHGRVNDDKLIEEMTRCDVLLNPHSPISQMANGVFPFKVIEGIASGRFFISTSLPSDGLEDVLQGVCFTGHSVAELTNAVLEAEDWFSEHATQVSAGAEAAVARFSSDAILSEVQEVFGMYDQ